MKLINSRYKIIKKLGTGRSQVFLSEDSLSDNKLVAIKILNPSELVENDIELLRNEFRILKSLTHPNIIRAYEFDQVHTCDDKKFLNTFFYTSEFVNGKNILDHFSKPFDIFYEQEFNLALIQIAEVLYYIHQNGIIHFDIRPENILIVGEKDSLQVKLIDFGFGALKVNERRGTPDYISPELIENDKIDFRTDLYSLGATLYHVLNKKPPFIASNQIELLRKHLEEIPEPLSNIFPKYWHTIIYKLLQKKPENRFANSLEIIKYIPKEFVKRKNYWFIPKIFVEKQNELRDIINFLTNTENKNWGIIIFGEYGTGKTTLLEQTINICNTKKIKYFSLNYNLQDLPSYNIILNLIEQIKLEIVNTKDEKFAPILKKIEKLRNYTNDESNKIQSREEIKNSFAEILIDYSNLKKFVVFIDDFDKLDDYSKEFFNYISPALSELGIKFIITSHNSFVKSLNSTFQNKFNHLYLTPLNNDQIIKILSNYFKFDFPYKEVAELIVSYTDCSPSSLNEMLEILFLNNFLTYDHNGFSLNIKQLDISNLPNLFQKIHENKLNLLTRRQKEIIEVLACLKIPVDINLLSHTIKTDPLKIKSELDYLINLGWIRYLHLEDKYFFISGGFKNYIYSQIKDKKLFHLKIANYCKENNFQPEVIAQHFESAGEINLAFQYYLIASQEAERFFSLSASEEFLKKANKLTPENRKDEVIFLLGRNYFYQASFVRAEETLKTILNSSNLKEEFLRELYLIYAISLFKLGKVEEATNYFNKAIAYSVTIFQKIEVEISRINLELSLGNFSLIKKKCENLIEEFDKIIDNNQRAAILNNIGIATFQLGFPKDSLKYFEEALSLYRQLNDKTKISQIFLNIGNVYNTIGRHSDAIKFWNEALEITTSIGNLSRKAIILNNIGISFFENFNYDEAIKYYNDALSIFKKIGDFSGQSISLFNLGEAYLFHCEYFKALEFLKQSTNISEKIIDIDGICQSKFLTGILLINFNCIEEGERISDNLLQIIENNKLQSTHIQDYLYLSGIIHFKKEEYQESEYKLNLAQKIYDEMNSHYLNSRCLLDLMWLHFYQGKFSELLKINQELNKQKYFHSNLLLKAESFLILGNSAKRPGFPLETSSLDFYLEGIKYAEQFHIGEVTWQLFLAAGEELLSKGIVKKGLEYINNSKTIIDFLASQITDKNYLNSYIEQKERKRAIEKINKILKLF